jgi:hypothetical protein
MKIEKEEYLNGLVSRVNEFVIEKDKQISQLKEEKEQTVKSLQAEVEALKAELSDATKRVAELQEVKELKIEPTIIEEVTVDESDDFDDETQVATQNNNSRHIPYGHDLTDHPEYENIRFSINSSGYVIVAYNNYVELCARLLLYNPKGDLVKKTDFAFLTMVGISADTVFTARCAKNKIEIQSYSLKMMRKDAYSEDTDPILGYYSIDINNSLVYFKVQTKLALLRTNDFTYLVYVFDKTLKKLDTFSFDDPNDLYDLKIKNDMLVYFNWKGNQFNFAIKSIKNKEILHRFELAFDSLFGYDIGPNGNIYILNKKQNMLNEYEISGKFVQTTKLNTSLYQNVSELCITDNFDFVINDKHSKNIYYIINGVVPKKRSLKTFVKKHILKMHVSTA